MLLICSVTDVGRKPSFIYSIYAETRYFDVSKLSIRYPILAGSEHHGSVRFEGFGVNAGDGYRTTIEFNTIECSKPLIETLVLGQAQFLCEARECRSFQSQGWATHRERTQRGSYTGRGPPARGRRPNPLQYLQY